MTSKQTSTSTTINASTNNNKKPIQAFSGSGNNNDDENNSSTLTLANYPTFALQRVGFGGILGFCTGYALKQAAKAAAVMVGGTVILLQGLQFQGWIKINWSKIQRDITSSFDTDGDGEFTLRDMMNIFKNMVNIMVYQGPTVGGFSAGIYYGFFNTGRF
jgi:uncharacterized membrane protein (Fun14 family)